MSRREVDECWKYIGKIRIPEQSQQEDETVNLGSNNAQPAVEGGQINIDSIFDILFTICMFCLGIVIGYLL